MTHLLDSKIKTCNEELFVNGQRVAICKEAWGDEHSHDGLDSVKHELICQCGSAQWHSPACSKYRENQAGEDFGNGNEVRHECGETGVVCADVSHLCEGDAVPVKYYDRETGDLSGVVTWIPVWDLTHNFSME